MKENIKKFLIEAADKRKKGPFIRVLRLFLFLSSLIYIFIIKVIIFLYEKNFLKRFEADCVLISIGNMTLGGTGKTPFLIYLSNKLLKERKRIAVVCRGYAEDEIKEVKFFLPSLDIFANRNRIRGIKEALEKIRPQYIILDDGFQHWRVGRNLDVVALDVSKPLEEKVLPAGFLREPLSHIKRANVIILTRVDLAGPGRVDEIKMFLRKIKADLEIFEISFEPVSFYDIKNNKVIPVDDLKGKAVGAFCGVGNNSAFIQTLERMNIRVASKLFFLDHHLYTRKDLDLISEDSKNKKLDIYVTTFKDILKIDTALVEAAVYGLKTKVKFRQEGDENRFFKLISGYSGG